MKIGYYQYAPEFGNLEENRRRIVEAVRSSDADLLVLPELATSGYYYPDTETAYRLGEPVPGPTTEAIAKASRESGISTVIGIPELRDNTLYNSAVMVDSGGVRGVYRKVHLFNEEKLHFSPGTGGFSLFEVKGVKIGLLVCFDHMFPEAARTLALAGAQIICHPSNLVLPEYGQLTTRVRALENRVFWILTNRHGTEHLGENSLTFTGESQIVDSAGKVLAKAGAGSDQLISVEVDPAKAENKWVTSYNQLFEDRRPELYSLG
ncbi:MAG: nitrilase-related carbon-nitrogen hydrolase [Spirochaetaceae bacterium]